MSKKINFISKIDHNGEKQNISFKSSVKITKKEGSTAYEFKEPNMNVMNRIEISKTKVNIFAGPSSINLELNQTISIEYETPNGTLYLDSFLKKIDISNMDDVKFEYTLSQNGDVVGTYNINLKIED